ncbi:MAG: RNA 2',3'-cyclic phosphodiesterase [Methanotrichaceae archaeon]|nr:RNA 2',3'-cyclic phosphodiesterase [Methanotrichaceae archaeon]
MTGIRCFVAVDLPASMREEIEVVQKEIATEGLRLVRPEIVHVTLKFLGDVPEEKLEKIVQALQEVKLASFPAGIRGIGAFPGRSIRVVWLGLEGDFKPLYLAVENALKPFNFHSDDRGLSPHVTLGRVGRPNSDTSRAISSKMAQFSDIDIGQFFVDRFFLKKSTLTRGGPRYDDIEEYPLRAA